MKKNNCSWEKILFIYMNKNVMESISRQRPHYSSDCGLRNSRSLNGTFCVRFCYLIDCSTIVKPLLYSGNPINKVAAGELSPRPSLRLTRRAVKPTGPI